MASLLNLANCVLPISYPDAIMSILPVTSGQIPLFTLLLAVGAGLFGGLLANWAADNLPRIGAVPCAQIHRHGRRKSTMVLTLVVLFGLLAYQNYGDPARLFVSWCYAWFLMTVLVIDLETRRVLNIMLLPAAVFALAAGLWLGEPSLPSMLGGAAVAFGLFWALYLFGRMKFGRGALGLGDVKLVAVIGLMTGYPNVLNALVIGVTLGGVAALALLLTRRAGWKSTCAYAPYLAAGAWLALWRTFGG
jgi:prepilin signal peptidase PulO-like enzyme (type II secretory pathway)